MRGSLSFMQLNLLSTHGNSQQTRAALVTKRHALWKSGASFLYPLLLCCCESAGAEGGLGTGMWSEVVRHVPWAIGEAHKFWSLLKAIPYKLPFPVHSSSPWLGLCAHTHLPLVTVGGRGCGPLPLQWLYFCVACCRAGRRWSEIGQSLRVMGSPVMSCFCLWHHSFMACLDKKQYSESPQDSRSTCCNPATDFDGLLLPSPSSCRDWGSWLAQEPLSHQHVSYLVEHQTASPRTHPKLLVAQILLLA